MKNFSLYILMLFTLIISSCSDDDPIIENPDELITTLTATFSPSDNSGDVIFRFQDLDGDGGNNPVITVGNLKSNTAYEMSIELLDESTSDVEDITEEIMEEDDEHQFFFDITGVNATIEYLDFDGDNNPLGLLNRFTTQGSGNGSLTIILRHEPDKNATSVSSGDITNAGGETDIEVTFNLNVIN